MEAIDPAEVHRLRRRCDFAEARELLAPQLSEPEPSAAALILTGRVDLDAGDLEAALARFETAIAAAPEEPDAYPWRVAALHRLCRREEAERAAVEATRAFPGEPQVWVAYARLLSYLLRREEALTAAEEAVRLGPDDPVAIEYRISVLCDLDRDVAADDVARDAVRRFPGEPDVLAEWAQVLSNLGRYPEAVEALADAERLDGDRPYLPCRRARRLRWLGRYDEAERVLRDATERFPSAARPWYELGDLEFHRRRENEALRLVKEAVRRQPGSLAAAGEHIETLLAMSRSTEAERAARAAIDAWPWDAAPWLALADVLSYQDRDEEALAACERALEIEPMLIRAMLTHVDMLGYVGRIDDAGAAAEEYVHRYPGETSLLCQLAGHLWNRNKDADALRIYERVLERDPRNITALRGRISALGSLNRETDAVHAAEQAQTQRPHDTEFDEDRAIWLWELGEYIEALEQLDDVLRIDPYDVGLQDRRVGWLRQLGHTVEAEARAREACELCPDSDALIVTLAKAQSARGHPERAAETLTAAIDRFGQEKLPYFASCLYDHLLDLGRDAEALRLVERAVGMQPEAENPQLWHVFLLGRNRRYIAAEETVSVYLARRPYSADLLIQTAWLLRELDREEDALERVETVLAHDPDHPEAWSLKRALQCDLYRFDEAEAVARQAIDRYPHVARFRLDLGWAYDDRGRYEEALAEMDGALAIDPLSVASIQARIEVLCDLRRVDEAVTAATEALAAHPDARVMLLHSLARAYDTAGRCDEALRCLDEILDRDPYNVGAAITKAKVLRSARRYDEAERLLAPMAERYVHNQAIRTALAWTRRDQGRFEESAADFERLRDAAACPSERADALYGLGWLDLDRKDPGRARDRFRHALEERPREAQIRLGLAWALVRADDEGLLPEAEELCLDLLDEWPRYEETYVCLGVINFRRGRHAQSEYYLRRSVELDPYGGSRVDLGALYAQLGRYEEAREQLETVLDRDWFDAQAHLEMGTLLLKRQIEEDADSARAAEAVRHFRQALAVDPPNGAATIGLALALAQGGEGGLAAAENELRRALRGRRDHQAWQMRLTLARLLIENGDVTQRAQMYEDAVTEAQAAIELNKDAPEPYFVAGVAEFKLGQAGVGADVPRRALHRTRARSHLKQYRRRNGDEVEADRVLRLIEQDARTAHRSAYGSLILSGTAMALLAALWVAFLTTDRVTPAMMMTLTPVMVGLVAVGLVLPVLVRLKLPGGVEADLSASLSQISSGPPGMPEPSGSSAGFGRGDIVVTPGPRGVVRRRE